MNRILCLALMLFFAGCQFHDKSTQPPETPSAPNEPPSVTSASSTARSTVNTDIGTQTAADLTRQYNDTRVNCDGSDSKPAVLCRGIMLKATLPSTAYRSWNPKPGSAHGLSFSYLSKDAKLSGLYSGWTNGFIFYPVLNRPAGTRQIQVMCAFPVDAGTDRRSANGCGAHVVDPSGSGPCHLTGIGLASQWVARWRQFQMGNRMCGYDVSDARNMQGAPSFHRAILSHNEAGFFPRAGRPPYDYMELILETWPQNIARELPMQAFIYVEGGLAGAQTDQRNFCQDSAGKFIPIIQIILPQTASQDAQFIYRATDQAFPSGTCSC